MESDIHPNDYAAKFLADMEAKYAALGNAIASVRAALNVGALGGLGTMGDASAGIPVSGGMGTPVALPRGAFNGKTAKEAILILLGAMQTRKTNKEIAQALKEGGLVSSGNFEAYITSSLFRLKEEGTLLRFDDGWGLAEWSPPALRSRVEKTAASVKRKATKKTTRKSRKPQPAKEPGTPGLQAQIETLLRSNPTHVFSVLEISKNLGGMVPGAISLSLGKMAVKGKAKKLPNGYQAPGDNVQQMPKAG
jgi:hypothetical protein